MKSEKDYLWLQLRDLPYFRALLRAVEARFYKEIELPAPTLDVGCGDGHFATVAFNRPLEVGLDPWEGPVHEAARRGGYQSVVHADGGSMPFPGAYFASAVSNSVLEHIPHVQTVLNETARVLAPGAPFVFCVPNHNFLSSLSIARSLDSMGLSSPAEGYRSFFNRISRHHHCDPPDVWQGRLEEAGFQLVRWWHYFSPQALRIMEWGHYFGLPSLVSHWLTRRWIISPTAWNLALTRGLVQPYYDADPVCDQGVYTFYITRRFDQ